ncbi:hypothetical protein [Nocardia jiangxiensis]|uniref:Uncharacterized protein n=1 Tax=Nocardia jiangxiensis TaxID=282685 RepID=A0ABW6SAJ0_9NOCA|nr:hypothetical protein [Nocardia jiangxiensis]
MSHKDNGDPYDASPLSGEKVAVVAESAQQFVELRPGQHAQ